MKNRHRLPKLPREPMRSFTRAQLAGRYVQVVEVRDSSAVVAFPNGVKATVPKEDLRDVESFGTFGSGG